MDDWELTVEEKGNDVEAVSVNTTQQGIMGNQKSRIPLLLL